jgi:hypothetical protein
MSLIGGRFSTQNDLNASGRGTLAFETNAQQGQVLFLLLVAQFADDLQPGSPQLIAFAEFVKKALPLILFYETWHVLLPSLCSLWHAHPARGFSRMGPCHSVRCSEM